MDRHSLPVLDTWKRAHDQRSFLEALRQYRLRRDLAGESCDDDAAFFVGSRGRLHGLPLGDRQVHRVFGELRRQLGWPNRGSHHAARIHDLRHTFVDAIRSRNLRLTALRAFLKFASRRDVTALHDIERALAVPMKRFERPMLGFLTRPEMLAVLGQPGESWASQRDHLLLAMLYNTGARVSEMIGVAWWMSFWTVAPACICTARDASCDRFPCGSPRSLRYAHGFG